MAIYIMMGKYSGEGLSSASARRTGVARKLVAAAGGKIDSIYATLGETDLVVVADFPDTTTAMKVSVDLAKMSGIAFTTFPAVKVEEFDNLLS